MSVENSTRARLIRLSAGGQEGDNQLSEGSPVEAGAGDDNVDAYLNDKIQAAVEELHGRMEKDYMNRFVAKRYNEESGPDVDSVIAMLAENPNHPDAPKSPETGKPAAMINLAPARQFSRMINMGADPKEVLAYLAYDTSTSGRW